MSTKQRRFVELFARLKEMGFTYEESAQLRRIEMTLHRWAELECGTDHGCIERDEATGKPFMTHEVIGNTFGGRNRWPIADREAGALRRLKLIVDARNQRTIEAHYDTLPGQLVHGLEVIAYHKGDCRGCALYLVKRSDVPPGQSVDSFYNRGLAVAA